MKRTLSAGRSRTELISSHAYGTVQTAAAVPPPTAIDAEVPEAQPTENPDGTINCPNCDTVNDPDAKFCDMCGSSLAAMDADDDSGDGDMAVTTPPAPAPGAPPVANPAGDDGIDAGAVCETPDCGHLASAHVNGPEGNNTGACTIPGCTCQGFTIASDLADDAADGSDGGDSAGGDSGGGDGGAAAAAAIPVAGPPAPVVPVALNAPPEMVGSDNMGPAFTIPVAVIEGQPTGDGREIAPGALDWRVPPLPLMGLATATHDPNGFDMNDPAVICGRIDGFTRTTGDGGTEIVSAHGFYLANDDGMYFADLNDGMGRMGVSVDVAVQATEISAVELDADGWPIDMTEILTKGTIMGITVCPYPAFEGAYIVLGDGTSIPAPQPIPQTESDMPATPPGPPSAVAAGGQLIRLMTYEECAPCDLGIEVVVASGAGPTRPPAAWFANPNFTEGDGRLQEIFNRQGQRDIGGKWACPVTVDDNGRVYGHIAPWGVCHTGTGGQCTLAPHSQADYAHFKRGQHIVTAEGDKIRVGVLTADTGHAKTSGISAAEAMAHYDNTALAAADVNIGEDEYGIWIAGAIRPDATDEQIRKLTAASISGDWRAIGGRLELVAALAVNNPGFPLAVVAAGAPGTGAHIESLVAAGAGAMHALKHPAGPAAVDPAVAALLPLAGKFARDRMAANQARLRIARSA